MQRAHGKAAPEQRNGMHCTARRQRALPRPARLEATRRPRHHGGSTWCHAHLTRLGKGVPRAFTTDMPTQQAAFPDPFGAAETELITVKEGLWALKQRMRSPVGALLGGGLNMAVGELSNGDLLAYSPVFPNEAALLCLRSLPGELKHIVVPNFSPEHVLPGAAMAAAFPDARVWVCPGLLEGKALGGSASAIAAAVRQLAAHPRVAEFGPALTEAVEGEVEGVVFAERTGTYREVALLFKRQGAVCLTDLAFASMNNEGTPWPPQQWLASALRVYKRLGSPVGTMLSLSDGEALRSWARQVAAWEFDTLCLSHLTPAIPDGRAEFVRCFGVVEA